ncbi:MAG TPA: cation transporting ATPase C-terminal domain-containing protein, partial [Candidatus Methanoperedens sp.]|nr:cation transporting ATPase C-terminal domain-containing protein [Candidatus Methanoperedens sp.]
QGASQVAGEEAALRITAGGLASLVGAVLAGRGVRGNIRRVVAYLLSVVAAESILVVALALVGRTVSVAPLQLLWVGLVAGALPALALGAESPAPAAAPASQRPRRLTALGKALEAQALAGGIAVAAAALGALLLARVWRAVGGEAASGTLLLATLSLSQLVHAFSYRRWTRASLAAGPAGGRGFLGAAALAALLTVAVVQVPVLGRLLGTAPLGRAAWAGIAALALLPLPAVALARAWVRGRPER